MREILFKGKRIDNDEWIIGNSVLFFKDTTKIYGELTQWREIEVVPETVGQFTGLTDKNGKKIFEGDILKIVSSVKGGLVENTRFCESEKRIDYAVVLQDNKTGGYRLNVYNKGKYKRNSKFTKGNLICYEAEIIGNTNENKELIGK